MTTAHATKVGELVPCELYDLNLNTFVALDLTDGSRVVGTVKVFFKTSVKLILPDSKGTRRIEDSTIVQAYWAPAGYRPSG